ncbi:RecQ family ATP-dependent DNA helicase [Hydrogenophaga sp.]|uniref:RecQ family ATP-dependent DNA helicase n=1 Tax=Hydrogenophaga sp. TaxID=1904254 RepID=UPI003AF5EDFF
MTESLEDKDRAQAFEFATRCIAIDLEVGKTDSRIHQIGAVRLGPPTSSTREFHFSKGPLGPSLDRLDQFSSGSEFSLGHNYIEFDRQHLRAASPQMKVLANPPLDTLWLNPLAFPRNPYHHLVKHYQDGQLRSGEKNNPVADARLALEVLIDQFKALRKANTTNPGLIAAWHWLTTRADDTQGFDAFFCALRGQEAPDAAKVREHIWSLLEGKACHTHGREAAQDAETSGWSLAYALAWLSVAGGNSVVPPWVRHQFPKVGQIIRKLRDVSCTDPGCGWCSTRHDATKELRRWFPGLEEFRPEPVDNDGKPLQRSIVESAMRAEHVLAILPTGTGKSICYQIPALSRFEKTGALTVVISPLVALMSDQVNGLEARGIGCSAAINGLLSMPERAAVLERIRLGDVGILIVSPEQLRNRTLRNVLSQREIGAWVLDEAHCISKWGHDFRPDYRYVGRFIKEKAGEGSIPPVLCLTATAKPDVVRDMIDHFSTKVGVNLKLFDGGASRSNLSFAVMPTTPGEKLGHVVQVLNHVLPTEQPGGAIVYCSTRKKTEEVSEFLQRQGISAGFFHAGLQPETKKSVQERFIKGGLKVIAATNAFGMGIDKPDVRLVIHADIPGSLENYLQEAGRAGRDREQAECVLLYTPEDVERQFGMSARSRLTQREIQTVLKSLRSLDRKKKKGGEVVATSGEILTEDGGAEFERDTATDDTRVRTAVAWLEEATLLKRDENLVTVFPSSLRVHSVDEAKERLAKAPIFEGYRIQLLEIVQALIEADKDEGISTDTLMSTTGLTSEKVRSAMRDLETYGISSNDMGLTAFVHVGVAGASTSRFERADSLEKSIIAGMKLEAPDMGKGDSSVLQVRQMTQYLKDQGHSKALPEHVRKIIKGLSEDGRGEGGVGSIRLRSLDSETIEVTLQREWRSLETTADLRRLAAKRLLDHLLERVPQGTKGSDLLAESTFGDLERAMLDDLHLKATIRDPGRLLDRALMWMHEQEILRLNKGLAVFRPAMTIHLEQGWRRFTKTDFEPLELHYEEQVLQVHVMDEYVQRGLKKMADAMRLSMDYFHLEQEEFLKRWMPNREKELRRQTTPESWRKIVEVLGNPVQKELVADDREQTNVLVLAGPGSGKTKVLVHRIAYLIRVRREKPDGILALTYNRHAAVEIRRRLRDLIGEDARGVLVMTCHAMAMRLVGVSFANKSDSTQSDVFRQVLLDAIALLKGDGLPPDEADEQRDRLLAGFRRILVDEYQDIGQEQYELISALAGRNRKDDEGKNTLFAVGDDDQNIYAFNGASVDFIRRFESDYEARPMFLIENYRSTGHVVGAANAVISPSRGRMKVEHPIEVNRSRQRDPLGGEWTQRDPVAQGRVQLLAIPPGEMGPMVCQAVGLMNEFDRLRLLDPEWKWSLCAVIAREWKYLDSVRAWCEINGVPVQVANEDAMKIWRLRETQALVKWIRSQSTQQLSLDEVLSWVARHPGNIWWLMLKEAIDAYGLDVSGMQLPGNHLIDWLADWGREVRRKQTGVLLLTAHRAKGLEFDHVGVLDGGWDREDRGAEPDETRRLFYVAMTRAKRTLVVAQSGARHRFSEELATSRHVCRRESHLDDVPFGVARSYVAPSLRDIDLGYSGRYASTHRVHRDIAKLGSGDALQLVRDQDVWMLVSPEGAPVGRMARAFVPPVGKACLEVKVLAVLTRTVAMVEESYRPTIKTEEWEVVVPELVFA